MPKKLLQDMVRVKRGRQIPLQKAEKAEKIEPKQKEPREQREIASESRPIFSKREVGQVAIEGGRRPRYMLWFVAVASIAFFLFALSYFFSKATVTINPKVKEVALNESLSAAKDAGADALSFDTVIISGEENKTVESAGEKEVFQKAEGAVVLFNTFSSASQVLTINTQLEGSNGKIYKTQTRTVVPGVTKDGKPGSVEVKIYGADAGEEYNSAPLDFKILNFKGTPKYAKFYGRSKESIAGGFKGKLPIIPEDQKASVLSELKTSLQTKLLKKATDQIPKGFILFKDAVFLNTDNDNLILAASKDNMIPVKLKGTLYGLLFDESKLTKKIAKDNIKDYDGGEVFISNIRNLTFSLGSKDNASLGDAKNITFNLSGAIKIVWKVDLSKLTADLLGKSKKDFNQILLKYPNVSSADLVVSPAWKSSIPDSTKKLKIIVNYPN